MPNLKGTAKKTRNKQIKQSKDLRTTVRNKFKVIFKLGAGKGNNFSREGLIDDLKKDGLKIIDEKIKMIKDISKYPDNTQKGIQKLFDENKGSLSEVLNFKLAPQKSFTDSLENYFNEKTEENADNFFKVGLEMSQEDINNLFRTEGAGMVEPEMVDPPKVKKPEKLPKVKVTNVSPVAPPEKSDEKKAMEEFKQKIGLEGIDYDEKDFFQWYNKEKTFQEIVDEYSSEEDEGEEKETMKQEEQPKPQEPPTMSPDERDVMEEEIKQEQLSEQKKDMPTTKRQPRTNIATFKSKMESIPESRLGTQGKEVNELVDDIEFFLKEFPSQLKSEKTIFNKVDKNNKNDLIKLHTKIATKLKPNISSSSSSSNKKVGIVINAESYIKEQMKKLLEEGVFSNLKPSDIVVDAAGTKKDNNEGTKDIGNFEVKETPDGGLSAKREGIYRYLPSENEQPNEGKKKKNNQLKIPKPQERNRATNAISMNKQNPFKRPQKTLKLKYLY